MSYTFFCQGCHDLNIHPFTFMEHCLSRSQGSASTFSYLKADPEVDQRKRNIHLHRQVEEAIIPLAIQWTGPSLPTEDACLPTRLRLRCLLPRDEELILTEVTVSETATGW